MNKIQDFIHISHRIYILIYRRRDELKYDLNTNYHFCTHFMCVYVYTYTYITHVMYIQYEHNAKLIFFLNL